MTRARSLFRKAKDYITYDLVEIIAPRSIPNPPGYVPPRKRSLSEVLQVSAGNPLWQALGSSRSACPTTCLHQILQNVYKGTKLYFDSWSQEKIDRHLAEHYGEDYIKEKAEKETSKKEWQELVEGFGECRNLTQGVQGHEVMPGVAWLARMLNQCEMRCFMPALPLSFLQR